MIGQLHGYSPNPKSLGVDDGQLLPFPSTYSSDAYIRAPLMLNVALRCANSRDTRGSGIINSSSDGIVAALKSRKYLDGKISVRVACRPSLADFSFITHKKLCF